MPGINHFSVDELVRDVEKGLKSGVNKILLFGVGEDKTEDASTSYSKTSVVAENFGNVALQKITLDQILAYVVDKQEIKKRLVLGKVRGCRSPSGLCQQRCFQVHVYALCLWFCHLTKRFLYLSY